MFIILYFIFIFIFQYVHENFLIFIILESHHGGGDNKNTQKSTSLQNVPVADVIDHKKSIAAYNAAMQVPTATYGQGMGNSQLPVSVQNEEEEDRRITFERIVSKYLSTTFQRHVRANWFMEK